MRQTIKQLYKLLVQQNIPTKSDILVPLSPSVFKKQLGNHFVNVIYKLRLGEVVYQLENNSNTILIIDKDIKGKMDIYCDSQGFITNIVILPEVPEVDDLDTFKELLNINGWISQFIISKRDYKECFNENVNNEVASLSKLAIAAMVFLEVEKGVINLNQKYKITSEDISFLSLGITKNDIGQEVTIKNLLYLSLIVSDNSAEDILMKLLGNKTIYGYLETWRKELGLKTIFREFSTTKTFLKKAWCKDGLSEKQWRIASSTKVVWTDGLGYFIPLELINYVMKIISRQAWIPWLDLGITKLIHKGGNAPGVLAHCWSTIGDKNDFVFSLVINKMNIISYFEEVYIYTLCQKLLDKML